MFKSISKSLMKKGPKTKIVVFIGVMGAIGNVLSGLSIYSAPLIPSIPLGAISISLALDLSHLSTFISALIGGPIVGAATGFIGGAIASYEFGFSQGNIITGFGLPIGKAITGATAGLLISVFGFLMKKRNPLFFVPTTLIAYIPEAIYTAFLFIVIFPAVFGLPIAWVYLFTTQMLIKASIEMVISGVIIAALLKNRAFTLYASGFLPKSNEIEN